MKAASKYPVRKVEDFMHLGRGIYRYTLSCGHKAERVGRSYGGYAIERPAKTCKCYECADSNSAV